MKRGALLTHLKKHVCLLRREGRRHTLYINPENNRISTIPRHREVDNILANKICKDLDIQKIK